MPQVYVGRSPDLRLDQVVRVLGGYRRLVLHAGQWRRVRAEVAARALSSWDPKRHDWVPGTGRRSVRYGASARELRLRTSVEVGK